MLDLASKTFVCCVKLLCVKYRCENSGVAVIFWKTSLKDSVSNKQVLHKVEEEKV